MSIVRKLNKRFSADFLAGIRKANLQMATKLALFTRITLEHQILALLQVLLDDSQQGDVQQFIHLVARVSGLEQVLGALRVAELLYLCGVIFEPHMQFTFLPKAPISHQSVV
jgi:hypothetical protein